MNSDKIRIAIIDADDFNRNVLELLFLGDEHLELTLTLAAPNRNLGLGSGR